MNPLIRILLTGLSMGESPRWHNGRLWVCDWGAQQIVAVDQSGGAEVVAEGDFGLPFCIDWLPDGRLLVASEALARWWSPLGILGPSRGRHRRRPS